MCDRSVADRHGSDMPPRPDRHVGQVTKHRAQLPTVGGSIEPVSSRKEIT